jgi:DNA modification methylase
MSVRIEHSEAVELLQSLPENSLDACITDPPYEIGIMSRKWDSTGVAFDVNTWASVLRCVKPGAHLLAFGGSRTYHRIACAIEDSGFELRDTIMYIFGSGFPKSHNLHGDWEGWGSSLKPAFEPIIVARKPFKGTLKENVLKYGTGAINIAGCRVPTATEGELGRWPANLITDGSDEVVDAFPYAPGQLAPNSADTPSSLTKNVYGERKRVSFGKRAGEASANRRYTDNGSTNFAALPGERRFDTGSAARFFYCSKPGRKERDLGMGDKTNNHPTVKSLSLMRYLSKLICPPGGTICDPFLGSGTTGMAAVLEGFNFIGCDSDAEYIKIAKARIDWAIAEASRAQ